MLSEQENDKKYNYLYSKEGVCMKNIKKCYLVSMFLFVVPAAGQGDKKGAGVVKFTDSYTKAEELRKQYHENPQCLDEFSIALFAFQKEQDFTRDAWAGKESEALQFLEDAKKCGVVNYVFSREDMKATFDWPKNCVNICKDNEQYSFSFATFEMLIKGVIPSQEKKTTESALH